MKVKVAWMDSLLRTLKVYVRLSSEGMKFDSGILWLLEVEL